MPSRRTSDTWIRAQHARPVYGLGLCLLKTGDKPGRARVAEAFRRGRAAAQVEESSGDHAASVIEELTAPPPGTDTAAKPAPPSPGNVAYVEAQLLRDRGHIEESILKFKQAIAAYLLAIRRPAPRSASCC